MDARTIEVATRFFSKAYTTDWDPRGLDEDTMLATNLRALGPRDADILRQGFEDTMKGSDDAILKDLTYGFGCQIRPFTQFGAAFRHRGARDFIQYILSFLDAMTKSQPRPVFASGGEIREADGTLVATLNRDLGDRADGYGRLFSAAEEMASFLEDHMEATMQQYAEAYRDAEAFNSNPNIPGRGNIYSWRNKAYPDLPEWVVEASALIDKIRGREQP